MNGPINTLMKLNFVILRLNETEGTIDWARSAFPADQLFQLKMDRHQAEIDEQRLLIAQKMAEIRNCN